MEERIENYLDSSLESVAPLLYLFSVIGGIFLIIIGIILIIKNKNTFNGKKKMIGIACIGIGFLALFSGIIQSVVL